MASIEALKAQIFPPSMDISANGGMLGLLNRLDEMLYGASAVSSIGGELGIIVDAPVGGGKTYLLKRLENVQLSDVDIECVYYDFAEVKKAPIQAMAVLLNGMFSFNNDKNQFIRLLLWDNIDEIGDGIAHIDLLWSLLYESLSKCHTINAKNDRPRIFCISTCTSCNKIPSELTSVLRLGSSVSLLPPNMDERKNILTNLLSSFAIHESSDVEREMFVLHTPSPDSDDASESVGMSALLSFLASHTRGCSIGDIIMLIRNEVQRQWLALPSLDSATNNLDILSYSIDAMALKECVLSYSSSAAKTVSDTINYDASSKIMPRQYSNDSTNTGKSDSNSDISDGGLVGLTSVQQKVLKLLQAAPRSNKTPPVSRGSIRACPGILLYGPSGCGKTALIEWINSILFDQYRMIHISCADLVQKVVGESEARLARYFQVAHQMAPCILVLDNIDSAFGYADNGDNDDKSGGYTGGTGSKRTANPALDRLLSSLLVEIDGISNKGNDTYTNSGNNCNVVVIATASSRYNINKALIRPGRIEEHLCLDMPSEQDRRALIESILFGKRKGMPLSTATSKANTTVEKTAEREQYEHSATDLTLRVVEDVVICTENYSYASVEAYLQQQLLTFMKDVLLNSSIVSEIRSKEGETDVSYYMLMKYMHMHIHGNGAEVDRK